MKASDKQLYHLTSHLVKTFDLSSFIETETGTTLKYYGGGQRAKCHCPMPDHRDGNASFHMKKTEDDIWIFHCFGCGVKGTIVHFCMNYFALRNKMEAILYLCKHFNVKNQEDIILASIKTVTKNVDMQRKMETANIVASNLCRILLRKDYAKNGQWVSDAYRRLNKALDEEDYELVEQIGNEAAGRV